MFDQSLKPITCPTKLESRSVVDRLWEDVLKASEQKSLFIICRQFYWNAPCRLFAVSAILSLLSLFFTTSLAGQSGWKVEIVDDGQGTDVGMFTSMAIDRSGNFHIGYFNASTSSLQYSYRGRQDQKWSKMAVERDAGTFVSLVADSQGFPHLTYNSPVRRGVRYAYWDGKQWHIQLIDPVATQFTTSIQLDASGNPRIAYFESTHTNKGNGAKLKYAYFDGTSWFTRTVALRPRQGVYNSLAIDPSGQTHIAFAESSHVEYATYDGSQWQYEEIDSTTGTDASAGLGLTLALDATGVPQLAYFDPGKKTLKYASKKSGVWKTEVVEQLSGTPKFPDGASIRLDSGGQPHIAYYDSGSGVLKYAVRQDEKWTIEIVDQKGNVGMSPSLSFDPTGKPYIAYYDSTNKQLRMAIQNAEASVPKSAAKP
jgi:hypothetical protein